MVLRAPQDSAREFVEVGVVRTVRSNKNAGGPVASFWGRCPSAAEFWTAL